MRRKSEEPHLQDGFILIVFSKFRLYIVLDHYVMRVQEIRNNGISEV